jgi:hypothetical protein
MSVGEVLLLVFTVLHRHFGRSACERYDVQARGRCAACLLHPHPLEHRYAGFANNWRGEAEVHVESNGGAAEQQADAGSDAQRSTGPFIVRTGKDARPGSP